ncbi:peroxisomal carnitine O-octanoyltransferase isoform X2 [Puntigrus tetrazona]|uniref:peroxisomal carnitine O-octanoyltransferase isoform X2 n=1 Tax=Puntigrus tetrazona TaxID=1606681 RepID=UPI001C898855|nr:peroxisomal carnitine O-octanoyltransferase isoform X2 [Puntigrus tetrazona]
MDNQAFESTAERTFQYQSSLPPLPVPGLHDSLSKYVQSVKPFASEEELRATEAIVKRFEEGIGQELHQKLLKRAKSRRNWLEDWWLDTAYLEVRIPSQLNVNFGGPTAYVEHVWPVRDGTQLERTSLNLWFTLQYWDLIRTERLAVHKAGTMPFDMDQFRMLFCTCKVPGVNKDTILNFFKTESEGPCPSHMIVMCRGRVFTFDALCDGRILTPPELLRQLTYIKECCDGEPEGDGVSALTTEERTRWAKARDYLISIDPVNKTILETIQSSLFVLALDDAQPYSTPENYTQMTHLALTGDPTIRWGDKSYNLICFSNGTFASNCDHAPYDAMVLVSNGYYVDQKLRACGGVWKGSEVVREMPVPEELIFTVDERVRRDIVLAKEQYTKSTEEKRQALNAAFSKHNKLMAEAQDGKGFDRHLLGLYLIAKEEGLSVPELYTDPLYTKSGGGGSFVLSTSLVGYTTVLGAVAPMVPHGYGFFYRIRDDRIVASCSAWKSNPETNAETLFQSLCTSLHDMMHVTTQSQL